EATPSGLPKIGVAVERGDLRTGDPRQSKGPVLRVSENETRAHEALLVVTFQPEELSPQIQTARQPWRTGPLEVARQGFVVGVHIGDVMLVVEQGQHEVVLVD